MKEFELSLAKKTKLQLIDIMDTMSISPLNVNSLRKSVLITLIMNEVEKIVNQLNLDI